jgi:hypothetical protein
VAFLALAAAAATSRTREKTAGRPPSISLPSPSSRPSKRPKPLSTRRSSCRVALGIALPPAAKRLPTKQFLALRASSSDDEEEEKEEE